MQVSTKVQTLLRSKAELIHARTKFSEFSPTSILTILSVLLSLYKIYMECNKTEERTLEILKKPSFLHRSVIKGVVKRSIPNEFDAKQTYEGIIEMGKETTGLEVKVLTDNKDD